MDFSYMAFTGPVTNSFSVLWWSELLSLLQAKQVILASASCVLPWYCHSQCWWSTYPIYCNYLYVFSTPTLYPSPIVYCLENRWVINVFGKNDLLNFKFYFGRGNSAKYHYSQTYILYIIYFLSCPFSSFKLGPPLLS